MSKNRIIKKLAILSTSTAEYYGVLQPGGALLNSKGPIISGPGNMDSICLNCESVIIRGHSPNLSNAAVVCNNCGITLDLTRTWNYAQPPILKKDLLDLDEIQPTYSVFSIWNDSQFANDLMKISDAAISTFDKFQGNIPLILQHYTNDQGLFGIVKSNFIWATDITYLNDSSEYVIATQMIRSYLAEKSNYVSLGCAEILRRSGINDLNNLDSGYFITCFCENRDLLSQWRGYGNAGSGYSMGISSRSIPTDNNSQLRRVIYDKNVQNTLVKGLVDSVCDYFDEIYSKTELKDLQDILPYFASFLSLHLTEFALCFKHEAFSEENEIRLIYRYNSSKDERKLKFRAAKDRMVPYMEIPLVSKNKQLPIIPLIEITYGPTMHKQLAKKALIQYLQQNSYQHVDVFASEAPYRE
jgi:hypothetical protein